MKKSLVIWALMMAANQRQPVPGLIHLSDRGSQYVNPVYQILMKQHGIVCSICRRGISWGNTPAERYFSSLSRTGLVIDGGPTTKRLPMCESI